MPGFSCLAGVCGFLQAEKRLKSKFSVKQKRFSILLFAHCRARIFLLIFKDAVRGKEQTQPEKIIWK